METRSAIVDFFRDDLKRTALFVTVSAFALVFSFFFGYGLSVDPAWVAILLCGVPILYEAAAGLILRHDIKADVLVAMALVASVIMHEYFAAGEVAFIMELGGLLESISAHRSNSGIEKLAKMVPTSARAIRDGKECSVEAKTVSVGETVRVLAGETVPLDGRITSGTTAIDQASLTGESLPVDKTVGDPVYSGTVNQMGTFDMVTEKAFAESSFQKLVGMVRSADADRTKIVRLADRWATYLVAIVVCVTIATYAVFGDVSRALTVMIVFCPCAFILATPTAIVAAIGNLAKHGILVRDGDSLENMSSVDRIAFDKTGTLTEGRPGISDIVPLCMSEDDVMKYAASAEVRSEHPLGKTVVERYRSSGREPEQPLSYTPSVGGGVSAEVSGKAVLVGNVRFLERSGVHVPDAALGAISASSVHGSTAVLVAVDGDVAGVIVFSDSVRAGASSAVGYIRANGAECVLLTGDSAPAAKAVADSVGVIEYRDECRPEDKMTAIKEMQAEGHRVCMVGDGINDAPSLKTAQVGIAMGGTGSGMAVEAADMVLVGDDVEKIAHLQRVSRRMMSKIRVNITFSMCWNFMAVALAVFGMVGPVAGALIHNVGSVAVVVNSFLLLLTKDRNVAESKGDAPAEEDVVPALR